MLTRLNSLSKLVPNLKRPNPIMSASLSTRDFFGKSGYASLKVKTKYTDNPKINPIFKNASTDGYVSF